MCHDLPPTVMVLAWARAFLILIPEVFPATPRGLRRTRPYSDTVLAEHVHFWLWSPKYFLPRLVFCDELGRIVLAQINVGHRFSYHLQRIKDSSRPALLRDQCRFTQYPSLIFLQWVFYEGQPRAHFGECKSRRSPPRKITAMDPGPDNARSLIGVTKTSAIKILGNGLNWAIF